MTMYLKLSMLVALCVVFAAVFFILTPSASAASLYGSFSVSSGSMSRTSLITPFSRRDVPQENTNQNGTATQGQDGADGASGADGGTVITGDESETVTVVNNGPTNNSSSNTGNNNGGSTAANGGTGGAGDTGGSVHSGGTSSNTSVFNSMNNAVFIITFRR